MIRFLQLELPRGRKRPKIGELHGLLLGKELREPRGVVALAMGTMRYRRGEEGTRVGFETVINVLHPSTFQLNTRGVAVSSPASSSETPDEDDASPTSRLKRRLDVSSSSRGEEEEEEELIVIQGERGSGRKSALIEAASATGRELIWYTPEEAFVKEDARHTCDADLYLAKAQAGVARNGILVVDDADVVFSAGTDAHFSQLILEFVRGRERDVHTVVFILRDVRRLHASIRPVVRETFDFDSPPSPHECRAIWEAAMSVASSFSVNSLLDRLVEASKGYTRAELRFASKRCVSRGKTSSLDDVFRIFRREHRPGSLSRERKVGGEVPWTLISPSHHDETGTVEVSPGMSANAMRWERAVGGQLEARRALEEAVMWRRTRAGEMRRLGIDPPRGVILFGPPGTGKTLLARTVARESGSYFLSVSIPDVVKGEVGESERTIARIFAVARRCAPCVLFFDEAQAIFSRRGGGGGGEEVGRKIVTQLLQEMDGGEETGVVIILATNVLSAVDPALLQPGRFDRLVKVDRLTEHGEKLDAVRIALERRRACDPTLAEELVAMLPPRVSGAEIDAVVGRAVLEWEMETCEEKGVDATSSTPLSRQHLEAAMHSLWGGLEMYDM